MSTTAETPAAVTPCKRGHLVTRVKNAQGFPVCPECVREDKRKSAAKRRAKVKAALETPSRLMAKPEAPEPATRTPPIGVDVVETESAPRAGTFLAVAREWLATQDDVSPATAKKRTYLLELLRAIHDRPINELATPEFVRALKDIEAVRDRRESAHRAGMFASQITRYAVNHGYATVNALPDGQLRGSLKPVRVESHAAITDPRPDDVPGSAAQRFGRLLYAILTYEFIVSSRSHPSVNKALTFAPYVFVRPGELRQMQWSEVNFDRAEWLIPGAKMKMRRDHLVPLSKQAMGILREQHKITGSGRYVFPAKGRTNQRHGAEQSISENGFREALRVVLGMMHEERSAHTMHGFRSVASTLLNGELGIDSALVEMQLAHQKSDKVAAVYDRAQRIPERRDLMQKWADYLDKLRTSAKE
jgi:integrase